MKQVLAPAVRLLAFFLLSAALTRPTHAQTVTPVPKLDLTRFSGTWYVIARLPEKRDKRCTHDSVLVFALSDKPASIQLLNACKTSRGYIEPRNTDGKAQDKTGDGKLKLRTIWPLSRKDWVLALGPAYEWSLVGSPNHKSLAILSRSATLEPQLLADIESKATAQGFPVAKLVQQPQSGNYKSE